MHVLVLTNRILDFTKKGGIATNGLMYPHPIGICICHTFFLIVRKTLIKKREPLYKLISMTNRSGFCHVLYSLEWIHF